MSAMEITEIMDSDPAGVPCMTWDGRGLKRIRTEAGVSATALAAAVGRSAHSLILYEANRQEPPLHIACALAFWLGVSVEALLRPAGPDEMPVQQLVPVRRHQT